MLLGIAQSQTPSQSALLFAIFGATFGLCFTAAGVFFAYALRAFTFLQRHCRVIEIISGVLLATQQWDRATAWSTGLLG